MRCSPLSTHGAIVRRPVPAGARNVVDTGHVVAFEAQMGYTLRRAARSGGIRSFVSLVAELTGRGDLGLQPRSLRALAGAPFPLFPTQQQGAGLDPGKLFD